MAGTAMNAAAGGICMGMRRFPIQLRLMIIAGWFLGKYVRVSILQNIYIQLCHREQCPNGVYNGIRPS